VGWWLCLSLVLPVKNHSGVIKDPVTEITVGSETGVVHVFDVVGFEPVTALVGAFTVAADFVFQSSHEGRQDW
jgi:hypothetical protein